MFLTNFGFRNRVFPQSLSCLYVTETWNFVPETCFFVPSSSRNVKIRFGSLSFFFFHVSVRFRCRYCVNTSKNFTFAATSFSFGIFLNSFIKLSFEYFSRSIYRQWRLIHYARQKNIYRHKNPSFLHLFPSPVHRILSNNAYDLWSYLIRRSCKVNIIVACLESIK